MAHGDYRRESFQCEHSLQSLLEMEGENGPAPPSLSSSSSPSPMGGEIGGSKPVRRAGRQESPLSRDTLVTAREKDSQTTIAEPSGLQADSLASDAESKTNDGDTSKPSSSKVLQKDITTAAVDTKSTLLVSSNKEAKSASGGKPQIFEATASKSKLIEKISTLPKLKGIQQQQDSKQQKKQPDSGPASKAQEKTEESLKGSVGTDIVNELKISPEQNKSCKGSEPREKGGICGGDKPSESTKMTGPTPSIPTLVQSHTTHLQAAARTKVEKVLNNSCGVKEERAHLEVLDRSPMSPSSNVASSCSSKVRPMSPGDKASFVTQLTSVAKTVLGPMKGSSQEGSKVKYTSKSSEEKRGNTAGKAEASPGCGRWGAPTATSASVSPLQSEKGNIRSSKHHS